MSWSWLNEWSWPTDGDGDGDGWPRERCPVSWLPVNPGQVLPLPWPVGTVLTPPLYMVQGLPGSGQVTAHCCFYGFPLECKYSEKADALSKGPFKDLFIKLAPKHLFTSCLNWHNSVLSEWLYKGGGGVRRKWRCHWSLEKLWRDGSTMGGYLPISIVSTKHEHTAQCE